MQKQKIDSTLYLVLQNNYEEIQIALYQSQYCIGKKIINKTYASKDLINSLDELLNENGLIIQDIAFIGVNQGPSPFTTLRVVIATANALNFGTDIPLIAIDGLEAFIEENKNMPVTTVALLNAYNNDVYFAIYDQVNPIEKGWQNITEFLSYLKVRFPNEKIKFIGNGTDLFKKEISELFNLELLKEPNPQSCSIEQIAKMTYQKWLSQEDIVEQLVPMYLKDAVKLKKGIA